ncbi:hypothetical protein NA57DRAFT_55872 [Rhizodiscina lignyota]|uniref:Uncharacterized protein n=1 Tax=Rhizodiscina lignyota TaxID=1504668 RepID=A0A9P4M7F7_9PEZI|nr:hypothetical protein NA57DRAFT_55872 [Rhizodiscina lignyota]
MYWASPFIQVLQWFRETFLELAIRQGLKTIIIYGYYAAVGMREWWLRNPHLHSLVELRTNQNGYRDRQRALRKNAYATNKDGFRDRKKASEKKAYASNKNGRRDRQLAKQNHQYRTNEGGFRDKVNAARNHAYKTNENGARDRHKASFEASYWDLDTGIREKKLERGRDDYHEKAADQDWLDAKNAKRAAETAARVADNIPQQALRFYEPCGVWMSSSAPQWRTLRTSRREPHVCFTCLFCHLLA